MAERDARAALLTNVLAIAGLIILIVIVLWGLIHIFSLGSGWFGSLFPASKNVIEVSAPSEVTSGTPFALRWTYTPKESGSYALLYPCRSDLKLYTPVGGTSQNVPCGSAYTLGTATSSVTVLPLLSASSSINTSLTVLYLPASGTAANAPEGSATLIVSPATVVQAATETVAPAAKPSNPTYSAPADLSVSILSSNVDPNGNATVSFDIANVGQSTSGVYYFTANLPTQSGYTYTSPAQSPLPAGSHVVSTLNFSSAIPGSFVVSVSGSDSNGANNFATQFLNASYNLYNQYQSQPTYYPAPQPYYQPTYGLPGMTNGSCYFNGATWVCNQPSSYSNGLPYYINSGQYPYYTSPYYNQQYPIVY
jgi:hypothetical protein